MSVNCTDPGHVQGDVHHILKVTPATTRSTDVYMASMHKQDPRVGC